MAITLNGTTGIASTGAYSSDGISFADNTPANTLVTGTSGNVGIGTGSPSTALHIVSGATYDPLRLQSTISGNERTWTIGPNVGANGLFAIRDTTAGQNRLNIDSSGNLLVGTTIVSDASKLTIQSNNALGLRGTSSTNGGDLVFVRADNNATAFRITANGNDFYIANGSFSRYAALSGQSFTGWTFASDERIKKNIVDISYGLNEVMAIKPREFDYISNDQHDIGFIAQELKEVIPEVVSGSEVEFSDTDTPQERANKTMGVSKDALIPVLVKAIQEQQAIITDLKARIETLENK